LSVGEHLRGEWFFQWRDCEIAISAPGIHHPAIEGFDAEMITDEDRDFAEHDPEKLVDAKELGTRMSKEVWLRRRVAIKRGQPTVEFRNNPLDLVSPGERPAPATAPAEPA
jgi:hypothetical protein